MFSATPERLLSLEINLLFYLKRNHGFCNRILLDPMLYVGFFFPSPLHFGVCVSVDSCLAQMRCHNVGTLRSAGTEAVLSLQIDS